MPNVVCDNGRLSRAIVASFFSQLNLEMAFAESRQIASIRELEVRYKGRFGTAPIDVSHWNPSQKYGRQMRDCLRVPIPVLSPDYIYPDEQTECREVLIKLGFHPPVHSITVAPSATAASVLCALFLKKVGVKRVGMVCPTYFAPVRLLELLDIEVVEIPVYHDSHSWHLPDAITDRNCRFDAVWLTDPLFSIGARWPTGAVRLLQAAAGRKTWIVIDQALGEREGGLHQQLATHETVIAIHSPHKALCINSFKFAAIVHPVELQDLFAAWSDVAYGGLSLTTIAAMRHFLTNNFDLVASITKAKIADVCSFLQTAAARYPRVIFTRPNAGYFCSAVVGDLPYSYADTPHAYWALLRTTGVSFISGARSRMPPSCGFSFRINLLRDCAVFRGAIMRLTRSLAEAK
jgi:histidinol-phosphate/aromatic aminotransferase/cobyric acid decarboxylase-like protein